MAYHFSGFTARNQLRWYMQMLPQMHPQYFQNRCLTRSAIYWYGGENCRDKTPPKTPSITMDITNREWTNTLLQISNKYEATRNKLMSLVHLIENLISENIDQSERSVEFMNVYQRYFLLHEISVNCKKWFSINVPFVIKWFNQPNPIITVYM